MIDRVYLNNDWTFNPDHDALPQGETVRIPHSVVTTPFHYFDESIYQMVSGYRKEIDVPLEWQGKRVLLTFEGVAHCCEVSINGELAGEHKSGYTAFTIDIAPYLKFGEPNIIDVKVDSRESLNVPPFGFVIDYMTYGGIYREVYIDVKEQTYIEDVFVSGDMKGNLSYEISISGEAESAVLYARVSSKEDGKVVFEGEIERSGKTALKDIKMWDIKDPNLYIFECLLKDRSTSEVLDVKKVKFGFRTSEFKTDGYYLNGRKVKIRGLNRHQSYPYVGYAMPKSMQELDADILKDELGVNAVRTSHYPQSHHFINRCDEIGLLVFTEIPGWQHIGDDEWKVQVVVNVEEMVRQYRNHPSIILWGVRINESVDDDALYTKTNELARKIDPTRPTGGVRYLKKSSFLEDVYTYNDFVHSGKNRGCEPKKNVTSDMSRPYMVTEYNGHMYPTKAFDSEEHRRDHALRHANVLDAVAGENDISGSFGWCMFDYNTHRDFGSGDRICYHGVTDMFRNLKTAGYVYKACSDLEEPFVEITSSMDIGEHPAGNRGNIYILTNCDSVKMYKNGEFIKEYTHKDSTYRNLKNPPILIDDFIGDQMKKNEGFSDRQSKIVKEALNYIGQYGMEGMPPKIMIRLAEAMAVYHMKFEDAYMLFGKYIGDWGGTSTTFRFDAVRRGEIVASVTKKAFDKICIRTSVSSDTLIEGDTYDVSCVRIEITDELGNIQHFFNDTIKAEVQGDIEILGSEGAFISGGMGGLYIKSKGKKGEGTLTLSLPQGFTSEPEIIKFKII